LACQGAETADESEVGLGWDLERVVPQTAPFRAGDMPMHVVNKHRARNSFVPSKKSAGRLYVRQMVASQRGVSALL
jgi:hypothetical protein